jgi:uncharacterized LabA/DUF88 family protein
MIADALRRQADQFVDLADFEKFIGRDQAARPARTISTPARLEN